MTKYVTYAEDSMMPSVPMTTIYCPSPYTLYILDKLPVLLSRLIQRLVHVSANQQ